ncbi:MFS transporter [Candidatus Dojkabacteria bacterium]|nr:MFS transporter [Candidatus Dojkabacteria bacterium]
MPRNIYHSLLKRNINLYYAAEFFSFLNFFIPIWVAYERQFISFTAIATIAGLRFVITTVLEVPTGALGDLLGRKWSVAIGFFAETIGLIIVGLATNGTYIFIGALFRGAADAFRSGSDTALVYDSLKEIGETEKFPEVKSKGTLAVQIALISSSILAGYLYNLNHSLPYFLYAFFLGVSGVIYFFMKEPKIDSEKFNIANYLKQTKVGIQRTFRNAYTAQLSIFYSMVGGISLAWQMFFNQIYASEIGYNEVEKSWLFAGIRLLNILILLRLLKSVKIANKRNVFLLFPILMLVSTLPAVFESMILGTMLLIVATFVNTARNVILDKLTNDEFDSKHRATSISVLNLYVSTVYLIFVLASGPIIDHMSMGSFYVIMGLICLVLVVPQGIYLAKKHGN